jgi:hypothetical protein
MSLRKIVFKEALEETVSKVLNVLVGGQVANDYKKHVIDLSIARTDELIDTNVHSLKIVSYTTGATFSIKLFSPDKDALTESDLPPGSEIINLEPCNVYLSNPSQTGATLTIIVFKRV